MDLSSYASILEPFHDKTVWLFSKVKTPSDYIGDNYIWQQAGSLPCSVLPATDKITMELYGPRAEKMMLLHAAPGAPVSDGMGVSLTEGTTEPEYTVVSAKPRMTHTYILIEAINGGN